jgi:hypothetical protein
MAPIDSIPELKFVLFRMTPSTARLCRGPQPACERRKCLAAFLGDHRQRGERLHGSDIDALAVDQEDIGCSRGSLAKRGVFTHSGDAGLLGPLEIYCSTDTRR